MKKGLRRAVFLDRDGVINAMVFRPKEGIFDSPYSLAEFRLLPGVAKAVRLINDAGLLAVVVSNQPGVAKGKCDRALLDAITYQMRSELESQGARLDAIYYCLHHPDGAVTDLRRECGCRKPKPGLLLQAAREHNIDLSRSYLVGDRMKDVEAGLAAGCTTILVQQDSASDLRRTIGPRKPRWVAADLLDAVVKIRQEEESCGNLHRLGEPDRDQALASLRRR